MPRKSIITSARGYNLPFSSAKLAQWINDEFDGRLGDFHVTGDLVDDWMLGKRLPQGCDIIFPDKHASGRHNASLVSAWVGKWLVQTNGHKVLIQESLPGWKDRIGIADAEMKERENQDDKRRFDEKWLLHEQHVEAMQRSHTIVSTKTTRLIETDLPAGHAEDARAIIAEFKTRFNFTQETADAFLGKLSDAILKRNREDWDALRKELQILSTGEIEEISL